MDSDEINDKRNTIGKAAHPNNRTPDFVCVGSMRCGTTTLWHELREHPLIFLPETKELHFFDANYERGIQYYLDNFKNATNTQICGEITPAYIFQDCWRTRLHNTLPNAKIIVILRDPVQRAWSHYKFSVLRGKERHCFKKALELEKTRIVDGYHNLISYSYVGRGYYADQIKALYELYGKQNVHILFLEELKRQRAEALHELQIFLDLDEPFPVNKIQTSANMIKKFPKNYLLYWYTKKILKTKNSSLPSKASRKLARSVNNVNLSGAVPSIPEDIKIYLKRLYEPHDSKLAKLIGRPLPW